jgi:hypothetical protein
MPVNQKVLVAIVLALSLAACTADRSAPDPATSTEETGTTRAGEKTYTMNGILLSRDTGRNTVNIDNEDVPGVMPPMKMDYELRGATVDALPPDGARVTMTLHEQDGTYWVTGVRAR